MLTLTSQKLFCIKSPPIDHRKQVNPANQANTKGRKKGAKGRSHVLAPPTPRVRKGRVRKPVSSPATDRNRGHRYFLPRHAVCRHVTARWRLYYVRVRVCRPVLSLSVCGASFTYTHSHVHTHKHTHTYTHRETEKLSVFSFYFHPF